MKKLLIISALSLVASLPVFALGTASITLTNGQTGNILTNIGPFKLISATVTAPSTTNALVTIFDSPTNAPTWCNAAYTNTLIYATNLPQIYTNFWGVLTTNVLTNAIVEISTNLVPANTNFYPTVMVGSAPGSSFTRYDNLNRFINFGLYFTNNQVVPVSVSVTYQQ